jgi:hypothetical protein
VERDDICLDGEKASLNVRVILPEEFKHKIEYGWRADNHWGMPVKEDPYIKVRPRQTGEETNFLMVLYPLSKDRGDKLPLITRISDTGHVGIKVDRKGCKDLILIRKKDIDTTNTVEEIATDGHITQVSIDRDGKVERYALHEGRTLTYCKMPLISVDRRVTAGLSCRGSRISGEVQLDEKAKVRIYSPCKPGRVLVNNVVTENRYNSQDRLVELNLEGGVQQLEI